MKVAYIAHPVGGDVHGNLLKIQEICREININEKETVPFVPYYSDLLVLDDFDPEERNRGIKNNTELISRGIIDELRLYGNRISPGMIEEITLAFQMGIPTVAMTKETSGPMKELLNQLRSLRSGNTNRVQGKTCQIRSIDGQHFLFTPEGKKIPNQIMSRVTDEMGEPATALIKLHVNIG